MKVTLLRSDGLCLEVSWSSVPLSKGHIRFFLAFLAHDHVDQPPSSTGSWPFLLMFMSTSLLHRQVLGLFYSCSCRPASFIDRFLAFFTHDHVDQLPSSTYRGVTHTNTHPYSYRSFGSCASHSKTKLNEVPPVKVPNTAFILVGVVGKYLSHQKEAI